MTTAPHGSRRAGFSFAPCVSRGLFAVCLICHFNTPVRRFNSGRCPYIAAALRAPCALFVGVWRGVAPCAVACRLRCQLAAALLPCGLIGGWPLLGGAVSVAGGVGPSMLARDSGGGVPRCQSRYQSRRGSRKSRWHSRCESRKRLRQSRSFYPKIIVVYKIPCISVGFFLPTFPELTESRSKVA